MKRFRVIFMGTPEFSVPCLEKLYEHCDVLAVVTQPDRPRGRGHKLLPSPVKVCAEAHGTKVYQPEKIKTEECTRILEELAPELIVVVAFGQILSQRILDIPAYGCINVHASLLPRYRGAAPMQWAIMRGESVTGVTTMFMDAGLDTGDMLEKKAFPIGADTRIEDVHDGLMVLGAEVLETTLEKLSDGTLKREKQNDALSTYSPMLNKETRHINWSESAQNIHNLVRGIGTAWTVLDGAVYKILRTEVLKDSSGKEAGTIFAADKKQGLRVATGDGALEILELQVPGKKRMTAKAYFNGQTFSLPARFEES